MFAYCARVLRKLSTNSEHERSLCLTMNRRNVLGVDGVGIADILGEADLQFSMIATARVQPAEAARIFIGKQSIVKPGAGSTSRLCSFSRWQYPILRPAL